MSTVQGFASEVLVELQKLDNRAKFLKLVAKKDIAIFGVEEDGEFVPILRLGAGTPKLNKMMLFVYHQGQWQTTCHKGTPKMLAQWLAGELNYLWTLHLL